jgi:micrococcal nuclease
MRWLQMVIIRVLTGGAPALAQTDCDPSYPDVCIPPPPPDLDCSDVRYRGFRVIGDDPHRDGIACER